MTLIVPAEVGRVGHLFYQRSSGTSRHKALPLLPRLLRIRRSNPHPRPLSIQQQVLGKFTALTSSPNIRTPRNAFGLLRQYLLTDYIHDPRRMSIYKNLFDGPAAAVCLASAPAGNSNFYPYPNESSFRLGDWYWSHRRSKSRESFRELLDIVGALDSAQMMCGTRSGTR